MSVSNKLVFQVLQVVSWILFIGLLIRAGSLVLNMIFIAFMPQWVGDLNSDLDLGPLLEQSSWAFYSVFSLVIGVALAKAYLFYHVVALMGKLDLAHPFNRWVSDRIIQISYYTLATGLLNYLGRTVTRNLDTHGYAIDRLPAYWSDAQAFALMGAVIYIIAVIFKRGVELQDENELTI